MAKLFYHIFLVLSSGKQKNSAVNNLIHGFFVISIGTGQLHFQILYVLFEVSNLRKGRIELQQVKMSRNWNSNIPQNA